MKRSDSDYHMAKSCVEKESEPISFVWRMNWAVFCGNDRSKKPLAYGRKREVQGLDHLRNLDKKSSSWLCGVMLWCFTNVHSCTWRTLVSSKCKSVLLHTSIKQSRKTNLPSCSTAIWITSDKRSTYSASNLKLDMGQFWHFEIHQNWNFVLSSLWYLSPLFRVSNYNIRKFTWAYLKWSDEASLSYSLHNALELWYWRC